MSPAKTRPVNRGTPSAPARGDLRSTTYELFILAVSVLSVANLA